MPEPAIAKPNEEVLQEAPPNVRVPMEIRRLVVIGTLDTGEEIAQEREQSIPKGMTNFEPVANFVWTQLGGMNKNVDEYTFEYYPLDRFKKFTLKISPIVAGNSLILP